MIHEQSSIPAENKPTIYWWKIKFFHGKNSHKHFSPNRYCVQQPTFLGALQADKGRTNGERREETVLREERALGGEGRGVNGGRTRERQAADMDERASQGARGGGITKP